VTSISSAAGGNDLRIERIWRITPKHDANCNMSCVWSQWQPVTVNEDVVSSTPFLHGVPQGSVLGTLLFILYTADVALIAAQHGVDLHSYADATQLYTGCSSTDASKSAVQLLHCIQEVDKRMSSNRLRFNIEKTQFIWLGSAQILAKRYHYVLVVSMCSRLMLCVTLALSLIRS